MPGSTPKLDFVDILSESWDMSKFRKMFIFSKKIPKTWFVAHGISPKWLRLEFLFFIYRLPYILNIRITKYQFLIWTQSDRVSIWKISTFSKMKKLRKKPFSIFSPKWPKKWSVTLILGWENFFYFIFFVRRLENWKKWVWNFLPAAFRSGGSRSRPVEPLRLA